MRKPIYKIGDEFRVIDPNSSCFNMTCVITAVETEYLWGDWNDGVPASWLIRGGGWQRIAIHQ